MPDNGNWSTTPWVIEALYNLEGVEDDRGTIINIILTAVQMVSRNQLNALQKSGLKYYRLEPTLTHEQSVMDNIHSTNISSLIKTANDYLSSNEGSAILEQIISALQENMTLPTDEFIRRER